MDLEKTEALKKIIQAMDQTYQEFLESRKLMDKPIIKGAFYATLELIVKDEPIPDDEMQLLLVRYVEGAKSSALDDLREEVDLLFLDVNERVSRG